MTNVPARITPQDPATLGYPATLPIEVALRTAPIRDICADYKITREDWEALRQDPAFIADVKAAADMLKKEGMSFKMKARLQADELLKTSWKLIHDRTGDVPPAVKADLLKFTIKVAGYEPKAETNGGQQNNFQINLNLA